MFGYSHTDVIGHHFSEFFPDDHALEELLGAARSGHPSDLRTSRDTRWLTPRRRTGRRGNFRLPFGHRRRCRLFGPSPGHQGTQGSRGAVAAPSPLADGSGGDTAELAVRGFAHHLTGADMQVGLGSVERPCRCFVVDEDGGRSLAGTAGDDGVLARLAQQLGTLDDLAHHSTASLGDGLTGTIFPISSPKGDAARTGALVLVATGETAPGRARMKCLRLWPARPSWLSSWPTCVRSVTGS